MEADRRKERKRKKSQKINLFVLPLTVSMNESCRLINNFLKNEGKKQKEKGKEGKKERTKERKKEITKKKEMFVTSLTLLMNEICRLINNLKKKEGKKQKEHKEKRKNERKKEQKEKKEALKRKYRLINALFLSCFCLCSFFLFVLTFFLSFTHIKIVLGKK